MPKFYKAILILIFTTTAFAARSQVIISLLFGDKLNSDKIEFGLIGGFNWSNLPDLNGAETLNNFNLGFYFHFNMAEHSYFSTGVLVKSELGATGMATYPIGDPDLDSVFAEGVLIKRIGYFHVPLLYHHRFWKLLYLEAGFQAGLRAKANDTFKRSAFNGDIEYTRGTADEYKLLDAGLLGGFGIKLKKQIKSMSLGLRYYHGLVNVSAIPEQQLYNRSLYLFAKIPIGVGKSEPK